MSVCLNIPMKRATRRTGREESEYNAFLDVERVWKGEVPRETWTWTSALQGEGSGAVGITGNSYLVYGSPNGSVDGYYAFPCATNRATLEEAVAHLGTGSEPRDFVATFDEPFPMIDGSPLGIASNGYVAAAFVFAFLVGVLVGALGTTYFRREKKSVMMRG